MTEKKSTGSAEKLFQELGQKIDELIERGKESSTEIRGDLDGTIDDTSAELKKTRDKIEAEFSRIREENADAIDEVKEGLKVAGSGIKKTFNSIFKKGKAKKKKKAGKKKS